MHISQTATITTVNGVEYPRVVKEDGEIWLSISGHPEGGRWEADVIAEASPSLGS